VLFSGVVAMEGSISGEHGIGFAKAQYIGLELSAEEIAQRPDATARRTARSRLLRVGVVVFIVDHLLVRLTCPLPKRVLVAGTADGKVRAMSSSAGLSMFPANSRSTYTAYFDGPIRFGGEMSLTFIEDGGDYSQAVATVKIK
jgi:hypothetical protein